MPVNCSSGGDIAFSRAGDDFAVDIEYRAVVSHRCALSVHPGWERGDLRILQNPRNRLILEPFPAVPNVDHISLHRVEMRLSVVVIRSTASRRKRSPSCEKIGTAIVPRFPNYSEIQPIAVKLGRA